MEEEKEIIGEDPELKRISLIWKRNQLLAESDKYVLVDYPISTDDLLIIKEYRQKLRDFTNNDFIIPEFPLN
jgi:hypothetical protein